MIFIKKNIWILHMCSNNNVWFLQIIVSNIKEIYNFDGIMYDLKHMGLKHEFI